MNILSYQNSDIRDFINKVDKAYDDSKKVNIPFMFWAERFLPSQLESIRGTDFEIKPGLVRYTSTQTLFKQFKTIEQPILVLEEEKVLNPSRSAELDQKMFDMLKEVFVPEKEFHYEGVEYLDDMPIWFESTARGVDMILGPENLDMSKPYGIHFGDDTVHSNIQGTTGCGKSVTIRTISFNLMLLYPPWEVDLNFIDNKGSESTLFARKVKEAHCKIIAATDAKDFLLDMYASFAEENAMRQKIFSQVGCSNIKDFRAKFNLILPRIVIIIDEFLQYLIAIENSAAQGNKKAGDEIDATFSILAKITSLGRNAGLHLVVSSQDLGAKLKPIVANQIQSGIALACTSDISTATVGNNEASTMLDRKGIACVNSKRLMGNNASSNVKVGIPFMDDKPRKGEQYTLPEEVLIKMDAIRDKYDFHKGFYFYDATVKISNTKYRTELQKCFEDIEAYPSEMQIKIPIGETISYTNQKTVYLSTMYKANEAIAIDSSDDNLMKYMLSVIASSFAYLKGETYKINICYYDEATLRLLDDTSLLDLGNKQQVKLINDELFSVVNNRLIALNLQELLNLQSLNFSFENCFKVLAKNKFPNKDLYTKYKNELNDTNDICSIRSIGEVLNLPIFQLNNKEDFNELKVILSSIWLLKAMREQQNLVADDILKAYMLQPILNFWFNPEDIDNMYDGNNLERYKTFLADSNKANVINVVYSGMWAKLRGCIPTVNYVLEFSNRDFVTGMGVSSFIANGNQDSLLLHDKRKTKSSLIKIYGGI